jgi:hypothetical protein
MLGKDESKIVTYKAEKRNEAINH